MIRKLVELEAFNAEARTSRTRSPNPGHLNLVSSASLPMLFVPWSNGIPERLDWKNGATEDAEVEFLIGHLTERQ